LTQYSKIT